MNSKLYVVLDKLADLVTSARDAIAAMDRSDTATSHQFVTAVSQSDGLITVSRAQPTADDISGLGTAIDNKINALDASDSAVANQFVTSVSEANGLITVTRAQPSMSNISGSSNVVYFADVT